MGEVKMKRFLTFKDLQETYGFSEGFWYRNAKLFRPALLMINGRAPRPHMFNADMIGQIITTASQQPAKPKSRSQRQKLVPLKPEAIDDLWR